MMDPSLVLYLPLRVIDGGNFMSRDAYGNLCNNFGSLWRNNGRKFDGVNDYIDCGNGRNLDFGTENFTVSLWLKTSSEVRQGVIDKQGVQNGTFFCDFVNSTNMHLYLKDVSGNGGDFNIDAGPSHGADGLWNHFVWVIDRENGQFKAYRNGSKYGDTFNISAVTGSINNNNDLYIGRFSNDMFNGLIGEVRICSRALRYLEIRRLYEMSLGRYK